MKKAFQNIFSSRDHKNKLAKSLLIGAILSIVTAYITLETTYAIYHKTTGDKRVKSKSEFERASIRKKERFIIDREFNYGLILIGFIGGTALGYLLINIRGEKS